MSSRDRWLVSITLAVVSAAVVGSAALSLVDEPGTDVVPVSSTMTTVTPTAGVVMVREGGGPLSEQPGRSPFATLAPGVVMGFEGRDGDMLRVVTACDGEAWIPVESVDVVPRRSPVSTPIADLGQVSIVLDPGHGGPAPGAVGPSGLTEAEVNLDIAERVWLLMNGPHDIDWPTGEIGPGTTVPAFGSVILTRSVRGPFGGDYEIGLASRAAIANGAGAHAFVSIHNNNNHNGPLPGPGTEVYHRVEDPASGRLAVLLYEELVRSFEVYEADWQGSIPGPWARFDPDTGEDYYGILRQSEVPAVIVEGLYLSNPDEEALLARADVRQAYAEGVYRALVRFFTTDEAGAPLNEPRPFTSPGGGTPSTCELPEQP